MCRKGSSFVDETERAGYEGFGIGVGLKWLPLTKPRSIDHLPINQGNEMDDPLLPCGYGWTEYRRFRIVDRALFLAIYLLHDRRIRLLWRAHSRGESVSAGWLKLSPCCK